MNDCVFCKIRDREIPKEFTYEDKEIMVFQDIHPVAQVHLLIVPKKHITEILGLEDNKLFVKLCLIIQNLIKEQRLENKGYRIIINGGGAQIIDHLHIHLIGHVGKYRKL